MKKLFISLFVLCFAFAAYGQNTKKVSVKQEPVKDKTVSRHAFTNDIKDREPVDAITVYEPIEGDTVYYFTELNNMSDNKVKHVWYKNNEVVFERDIDVKADRWRYPTSMKAVHFKKGDEIKVEVIGDDGTLYVSDILKIQ